MDFDSVFEYTMARSAYVAEVKFSDEQDPLARGWEEWVRNNLFNYLQVLGRQRSPSYLLRYMRRVARTTSPQTDAASERNKEGNLINTLRRYFPHTAVPTAASLRNFLTAYDRLRPHDKNALPTHVRPLAFVYAYHLRRAVAPDAQEEKELPWDSRSDADEGFPQEPVSYDKLKLLDDAESRRQQNRTRFVECVRIMMAYRERWTQSERKRVVKRAQALWATLDAYSREDLAVFYKLIVKQYHSSVI